jgi:hypothetical protein
MENGNRLLFAGPCVNLSNQENASATDRKQCADTIRRVARRTGCPAARNVRDPLGDGWSEHGGAVRRDRTRNRYFADCFADLPAFRY